MREGAAEPGCGAQEFQRGEWPTHAGHLELPFAAIGAAVQVREVGAAALFRIKADGSDCHVASPVGRVQEAQIEVCARIQSVPGSVQVGCKPQQMVADTNISRWLCHRDR